MSTPIGHPFERKQVTARIHNGDAHDLFSSFAFSIAVLTMMSEPSWLT